MARIGEGAPLASTAVVSTLDTQAQVAPQNAAGGQIVQQGKPALDLAQQDTFVANPQIAPGGCFPGPQPQPLPFPLPEPTPLPHPIPLPPLPCPQPRDASADAALQKLDQQPGPISGQDMAKAIKTGTEDLDGQGANQEYNQFKDWVTQNGDKMSPEAKEVWNVYDAAAKKAQAKGQTGIDQGDYKKMCDDMTKAANTDVSAKQAIDGLKQGDGKISGEDMTKAIEQGTKDLDNHSATMEYDQFAKFAKENPGKLSPEAKQVMDIYKKYADQAKAAGQNGIAPNDYQKMLGEMKNVKTYQDASMGQALDGLNHTKGPISGQKMMDAIKNGTQDTDGQAAGTELQDTLKWARENASRLSPEAKKMVAIYMKYATQAVLQGQTGISQGDYQKMLNEMKHALQPPPRYVAA